MPPRRKPKARREAGNMDAVHPYERIALHVYNLDRSTLIYELTHFDGPFPLDFSGEYLASTATEKLRHMLAAAMWRAQRAGVRVG
jgi:hypothetical protein